VARTKVADKTGVRVMAERCSSCIFRPGNLMSLQPGRVKEMVDEVRASEGCIPCHKTLDLPRQAVCRGQFDTAKTSLLQIAERLNAVVWVQDEKDSRLLR
jgi:uncharacterized protein YceK